jgi:glycosyltransferase involved in cell wall biosynthesis
MRILHVAPRYWPALGGAESHIAELSQRLAAEGHAVTVVTTAAQSLDAFWSRRGQTVSPATAEHEGVRILRFPVRYFPMPGIVFPAGRLLIWFLSRIHAPVSWLHRFAAFAPWTPQLLEWLESTGEEFDLVGAFSIVFEGLCHGALRYAEQHRLPFVLTPFTHLGAGPEPGSDRPSRAYTMRHQLDIARRSAALIAMTPTERSYYTARGVDSKRIHVVGSGVTPSRLLGGDEWAFRRQFGIETPIVAYLNALAYDKGATTTIEALRRLWDQGHDVSLVMAGSIMADVRRYLADLPQPVRDRVTVLGPIDELTKRNLLAACSLLVNPSRIDSFGIVFLEAWLYRKPVIGSTAWGMADVVSDGDDGLLTSFGDAEALAAVIARLLRDRDLSTRLGAAGEVKVHTQHTWERTYAMLSRLYRDLVAPS